MLQTYEATLEPSGQVWFTDFSKPVVKSKQKILITIVSPWVDSVSDNAASASSAQNATSNAQNPSKLGWENFAGALKNAPAFAGNPLTLQQQLRSEWQ